MLEASAWDALEASQFDTAAAAFREAISGDPGNARLHLGAGAAAFALRRDADARAALERALELNPALPQARELLGRVLYRTGNFDDAIRVYEALLAETPARTGIAEPLERWRHEAELRNRMDLAVGNGVTVAFDGPEDAALAAEAVASIERASVRIWDVLSFYPTRPIAVVLYTNEQFRDITRSPSWAAGAFDGTIRIPMRGALANPAELDRVLAHEYTHALVHELAVGGVPAWLDEGLAAALERDSRPRDTRRSRLVYHSARWRSRSAASPIGTSNAPMRSAPSRSAACSTRPAGSPSPICFAISVTACRSTPRSSTACSAPSPPSKRVSSNPDAHTRPYTIEALPSFLGRIRCA